VKTEPELPFERSDQQRYPISITWQPPFTMMVDLTGQEDFQVFSAPPFILCKSTFKHRHEYTPPYHKTGVMAMLASGFA